MLKQNIRLAVGASLGAVSARLGITARALRHYEARGLIEVTRDRFNHRRYDTATQRQVELVVYLRRCGIGLAAIAEALAVHRAGGPIDAHIDRLLEARLRHLDDERQKLIGEMQCRRSATPRPRLRIAGAS